MPRVVPTSAVVDRDGGSLHARTVRLPERRARPAVLPSPKTVTTILTGLGHPVSGCRRRMRIADHTGPGPAPVGATSVVVPLDASDWQEQLSGLAVEDLRQSDQQHRRWTRGLDIQIRDCDRQPAGGALGSRIDEVNGASRCGATRKTMAERDDSSQSRSPLPAARLITFLAGAGPSRYLRRTRAMHRPGGRSELDTSTATGSRVRPARACHADSTDGARRSPHRSTRR